MENAESARSVLDGFRLPIEGGRLIMSDRRLWAPAMAPIGFSLVAFGVAISLLIGYAGDLYGWATQWMPVLEAQAWWAWLWIGPAKAGLTLIGTLLFLAIAGVSLLISFLVASILASPFLDTLSFRAEAIQVGEVVDESASGVLGLGTDALRAMREELRRVFFFLLVVGSLTVLGIVIPGAQLVSGPLIVGITILFLPLDYASYTLDRRQLSFREKRDWLMGNKPPVVGFGSAAFLICVVPGLNFVAMPLLVAGGTLLVLRQAPKSKASASKEEPARAIEV
jgi:CysZ protein